MLFSKKGRGNRKEKGKRISNSVGVCTTPNDGQCLSAVNLSPRSNIINIPIALCLLNCDPGKWLPYFPHRDNLFPMQCPTFKSECVCLCDRQLAVNYRQFKFGHRPLNAIADLPKHWGLRCSAVCHFLTSPQCTLSCP